MTISDDRSVAPPPPPPPSFVRRHPIVAGFGVLAGLSLFSALWPASAIVIMVAIAGHATGLDRVAWSLTRTAAARAVRAVSGRLHHPADAPGPGASGPAPAAPEPSPSAPTREVHAPSAEVRPRRAPRVRAPGSHASAPARRPRTPDHPVETHVDGPAL